MATRASSRRVTVDLPPWVVEKLDAEVKQGRYASMEDAVLAGARLLAGLGPRARELMAEGGAADEFIRTTSKRDGGDWL